MKDVPARKRLGSLEVSVVSDELLDAMEEGGFCPHFHLSLQSGSAEVLRAMNRHYTPDEYMRAVEKIRAVFPLAGITTDVIAAFPSETDKNFEESLAFCLDAGFSDIHVFPFSPREGTAAAKAQKGGLGRCRRACKKACRRQKQTQSRFSVQKRREN